MKRRTTQPRTLDDSRDIDRVIEQDPKEVACLERLCDELEHPSRSRREGARAAFRCLSHLVTLRASANGTASQDEWIELFSTTEIERAAVQRGDAIGVLQARAFDRADPSNGPVEPSSVSEVVDTIERAIRAREEAKEIALETGRSFVVELAN